MSKLACVFPGQGAQAVGMCKDLYEQSEKTRKWFERADQALGYSLSEIIFHGPEEKLKLTYHTQPALLTTSIACWDLFLAANIKPDFLAGHSLGEYSALVASGVFTFEDAIRTVRARGEFMDQAVPAGLGAMAAVLGAERDALQSLCAEISLQSGIVELANINCPGQIVVSGSKEGVQALIERSKEAGAKRVIPLEVSGPFHSSMMKPIAQPLADVLAKVSMHNYHIPVISNVKAKPIEKMQEIPKLLVEQVYSPVLWEPTIVWLIEQGVDTFIELGSGQVLNGLIKKINRDVTMISIGNVESMQQFLHMHQQKS
jgi:[acyl-carrier-protein] S-malonyltransferase